MPFDLENFTLQLIAETLFYDEDTESFGGITLVDEENRKERFFAAFEPSAEAFVIEEATEWEEVDVDGDGTPDFSMGIDGKEHGSFATADECAEAILKLAREQNLAPSVTMSMEMDEDEDLDEDAED